MNGGCCGSWLFPFVLRRPRLGGAVSKHVLRRSKGAVCEFSDSLEKGGRRYRERSGQALSLQKLSDEVPSMTIVLTILAVLAAVAAVPVALAHYWARTPHGRLKPLFAFVFRMQSLFDKTAAEGVLVRPMDTPAQREAVRARFLSDVAPLSKPVPFTGTIEDRELDGPGGKLPVRIYTPAGPGPFPGLVYLHGGGFIVGSPQYTDAVTRTIALRAPAVVVSIDYRLSPEAPWPAPIEDAEFVVEWCIEHAGDLKMQPESLAIGGDSAGGNLSAVLAQRDRDSGRKRLGLQVLIYPAVDMSRLDRTSQVAFGSGYGLSTKDLDGCYAMYVQGVIPLTDPAVSPLFATSLEGLPRALVFTAGFDVLRDEGTEYARKLEQAGVPVDHTHEPAMPHGYITTTRFCREATDCIEQIAAAVRALGAANHS